METIPEFGIKRENEERRDGGCAVVFDPQTQKYAVNHHAENSLLGLISGGINVGENIKMGVLREVVEESGLDDFLYIEQIAEALTHYHNMLKNVDRVAHATCFLVILKSTHEIPVHREAHEKFTLSWATPQEIFNNWNVRNRNRDYDHWIYFLKKSVEQGVALGYDTTTHLESIEFPKTL